MKPDEAFDRVDEGTIDSETEQYIADMAKKPIVPQRNEFFDAVQQRRIASEDAEQGE